MNGDSSCRRKNWRYRRSHSKSRDRKQHNEMDPTVDFAFLQNENIIQYFKESEVMIILRGLPGSGKSFLASKIKQKYGKGCFLCSADQFFEHNGEYNFDSSKLHEAHQVCQQKAQQACLNRRHLIVIDNCNICKWEMEFYLDLADQYGYVPLIVEPKTPWKFTLEILAAKNNHRLNFNLLERKLNKWEYIHSLYFAWFVNQKDSACLRDIALSYLQECEKIPQFYGQFQYCVRNPNKDFIRHFSLNQNPYVLHCTAMYCGKSKGKAKRYAEEPDVQNKYGKISKLTVVGFIVSNHSFGACVNLNSEQLKLWRQEDYSEMENTTKISNIKPYVGINSKWENDLIQALTSVITNTDTNQSIQCPAHITLGNKKGIPAKQTGVDLSTAFRMEMDTQKYIPTYNILGGWVKQYDKYWLISLEQGYQINALFSSCI